MPVRGNPVLIPEINQGTFPLFSLPLELRGLVYFETLRTSRLLIFYPIYGPARRPAEPRRTVEMAPEIEQMSRLLRRGGVSPFTRNCISNGVKLYCPSCKGKRLVPRREQVEVDLRGAWQGNQQQQQTGTNSPGRSWRDLSDLVWCRCTDVRLDFLMVSKRVFREALPMAWQANMMCILLRSFGDPRCADWTSAMRVVPHVQVSHIRRVVLDLDDNTARFATMLDSDDGKEFLKQLTNLDYLKLMFNPEITLQSVKLYASSVFFDRSTDMWNLKRLVDVLINCGLTSAVAIVTGLLSPEVEIWLEQAFTGNPKPDFDWVAKTKTWIDMQERTSLKCERQEEVDDKDYRFNYDRFNPNQMPESPPHTPWYWIPFSVTDESDTGAK